MFVMGATFLPNSGGMIAQHKRMNKCGASPALNGSPFIDSTRAKVKSARGMSSVTNSPKYDHCKCFAVGAKRNRFSETFIAARLFRARY
jgi:hypothetical protein